MGRLDFFAWHTHTRAQGVGSLEIGTHWNRSETEMCDKKCHSLCFCFFAESHEITLQFVDGCWNTLDLTMEGLDCEASAHWPEVSQGSRVHSCQGCLSSFISPWFTEKWTDWVILMLARPGQRAGQLQEVFPWMHFSSWPPSQAILQHSRDKCRQQPTVDCCKERWLT